MPANLVFTLTAGRTGTRWLTELLGQNLPGCEAHHEILGHDRFGVDTPDLSHLTLFNSRGLCDEVHGFWERKAARVAASDATWYVETSHVLMKAGLVEHIDMFTDLGPVHLIALGRDLVDTVASYTQRHDLANVGNQWLWYLDPSYPQNIIDPAPLLGHGLVGVRAWYALEIRARQAYYEALLADDERVVVHRATLEGLQTESGARGLLRALGQEPADVHLPSSRNVTPERRRLGQEQRAAIARFCAKVPDQAETLGREFHFRGRRLGQARDDRSVGS